MNPSPTAVFDTTEASFPDDVVAASRDATILVDFHASWCGPCKVLGPILSQLAEDSGGTVRLAKVDTEAEPRLAAAFRVQSIPFVVAFQDGQPVDAFVGQKDEKQVREFLKKNGVELGAPGGAAGGPDDAPLDTPLGKAEALLRGRRLDEIERVASILGEVEEDDEEYTRAQRLLDALPFFAGSWEAPGPAVEPATAARQAYVDGDEVAAMHALFECVQADRGWEGELGRRALVAIMHLHPEHAEVIDTLRRRLAVLLY